jgi:hypothetical protein
VTVASSALPSVGNPRAKASVVLGLLSAVCVPAGVAASYYFEQVTLVWSAAGSVPAGVLLGWIAVLQARRGREQFQRTLGRSGGESWARLGRLVGVVGVCTAITAALAVGFYGLLTIFD